MCKITKEVFGVTKNGEQVNRFTLSNDFITAKILDFGGIIQSLIINNKSTDVVLGLDSVKAYEDDDKFLGALVGRCANRIAGASFDLDGKTYTLPKNNGENHLHDADSLNKCIMKSSVTDNKLVLICTIPDGQNGFPGNLDVKVTYSLKNSALLIDYEAKSDCKTLCNLTNHTYWNLSGHDSGSVGEQIMQIFANYYTPTTADSIPLGELEMVDGTPFDFLQPTKIGLRWDDNNQQLVNALGYDHNFVINGEHGTLRPVAIAKSEKTGIEMKVYSTMAGVQFYTGNFLDTKTIGKNNAVYDKRTGFCLETQFFPDAIHHPMWAQPVLNANETWHSQTIYEFSL